MEQGENVGLREPTSRRLESASVLRKDRKVDWRGCPPMMAYTVRSYERVIRCPDDPLLECAADEHREHQRL